MPARIAQTEPPASHGTVRLIHIYPANRIENLALLFDHVLRVSGGDPLAAERVVVQNQGMRHWLSMRLAERSGVCMNLEFLLPSEYFWRQINALANDDPRPAASRYSREVMAWRLDALLGAENTLRHPLCARLNDYWRGNGRDDLARRFQLASQLADLFEQYLIYRPDWISEWEQADDAGADDGSPPAWQAWLWRQLLAGDPDHPLRLYKRALARLPDAPAPPRVTLFGLNALPPLWLDFLGRLGERTQIHLFHLNPCVEYWGDLRSEKQLARQFARWADDDIWANETGHPLLASLGAQGREFLSLLQERANTEIPLFEAPAELDDPARGTSLLHRLQNDILELRDARERPEPCQDDSLTLVSAHNALREVQGLHDWLLHRFDEDPTLRPRDILVMCPNIERYAPYIEAVFTRDRREVDADPPRLPCSIADRVLKDAEPLVAAFAALLELPDSRFRVSEVLAWLRLPAVQARFGLSPADLERIARWLRRAAVHWGLDGAHKADTLRLDSDNARFTWQQGLERLLLGFAHGDREALYQDQLLLPDVEGDDAIVLGRLIQSLDTLRAHAQALRKPRPADAWRRYLKQLRDELFSELPEDQNGQRILAQVIDDFGEYTQLADYRAPIPLAVVRDYLNSRFAVAEPGHQFLTGQITFCSMIPMRSIPFRIIAVLGLNDGEYPRQRPPLSFDLIAESPRRGDRSRRGDDRYLFLEVLISARERLYLSYQGNDIKTNQERQPSLILQELMDYLEAAHGWSFRGSSRAIRRLPLQAFSPTSFAPEQGDLRSYDRGWARLARPTTTLQRRRPLDDWEPPEDGLTVDWLIDTLAHPPRAFSRERLGLWLDTQAERGPEDSEPFASDHLLRYQLQQQWIEQRLGAEPAPQALREAWLRSGRLPDTPKTEEELDSWIEQADAFAARLIELGAPSLALDMVSLHLDGIALHATLPRDENGDLLFHRLAEPKGRDLLTLWLHHLIAQALGRAATTRGLYRHKKQPMHCLELPPLTSDEASQRLGELLALTRAAMREPLLLNADLARGFLAGQLDEARLQRLWLGDRHHAGLGDDPYLRWFWPEPPTLERLPRQANQQLYRPLFEALEESTP